MRRLTLLQRFLFIFILTLSIYPASAETLAMRGQVADMLLAAADDYQPGLERSEIIHGYEDGQTREDQPIARVEAFIMISRAFSPLPEPDKYNARLNPSHTEFSDMPAWAKPELKLMIDYGLVMGTDNGIFSPDDYVTVEQIEIMIGRMWSYYGTNLSDDFYSTVNKDALNSAAISPGESAGGTFYTLNSQNNRRVANIIRGLVTKKYQEGTKEQKISDYYHAVADVKSRDATGLSPILSYLEAIDRSQTIEDLLAVRTQVLAETGISLLWNLKLEPNPRDNSKYSMYIYGAAPLKNKEVYLAPNNGQTAAYLNYLISLLLLSGEPQAAAVSKARQFFDFEKNLAYCMLDVQDYSDVDQTYHPYTVEDLQDFLPNFSLSDMILSDGYQIPDRIIVSDRDLFKYYSLFFEDENFSTLQLEAKILLLRSFSETLSSDFVKIESAFQQEAFGAEGYKTAEEAAVFATQAEMSDYLDELYVRQYFSSEAIQDVAYMALSFVDVYKKRIAALDWMSQSTKQTAIKKLNTLKFKIGYPDSWTSPLDNVNISGAVYGENNYYNNYCAISRRKHEDNVALQNTKPDNSGWPMHAYEVNASYSATSNEIVIPAGILQPPFYSTSAGYEKNLAGIGFIIAHEITHCFDNFGAKYDEQGNANKWWSRSDYEKFGALCDKVATYYHNREVSPGILNNGHLTLSENIADLGGIACVLQTLAKQKTVDYKRFFESFAASMYRTGSREYFIYLSQVDVHSADKIRINRTISCFEEFYQAYGITQNDGMYVPPENRVQIW